MEVEPQPAAPAVVAVVVTCDPGSWFEPGLSSLVNQDYPNLSVLVIDSASEVDPTPRVAAVIPGAFVMRLERRVGFGRAANEVLKRVEGASHLLFCHDDVALAPDAVRCLLEEAFRSNAGITSPKYVQWDDPDRLLAVGATADKVGVVQDLVEPGELDQQQHDGVREVFVAPGGAMLVRADLFRAVGGFNATIDQFGEDLDLSWRARVAGARVVVVPAARVRHLEAIRRGVRRGLGHPGQPASSRSASRRAPGTHPAHLLPLVRPGLDSPAGRALHAGRGGHPAPSGPSGRRRPPGGVVWAGLSQSRQVVAIPPAGATPAPDQRRRDPAAATRGNARLRAFVRERVDDVAGGPAARRRCRS